MVRFLRMFHVLVLASELADCEDLTSAPANDSQMTFQIISMLWVHKGYILQSKPTDWSRLHSVGAVFNVFRLHLNAFCYHSLASFVQQV